MKKYLIRFVIIAIGTLFLSQGNRLAHAGMSPAKREFVVEIVKSHVSNNFPEYLENQTEKYIVTEDDNNYTVSCVYLTLHTRSDGRHTYTEVSGDGVDIVIDKITLEIISVLHGQ